jgi:uncharacterized membrane protein
VAFVFYFTEKKRSKEFDAHIKHWMTIFLIFILLRIVLRVFFWWLFGFGWWLWWIITLLYLIISWVLFFKAYNWEDVNIWALDDFEEKMEETITNKKDWKEL